MNRCFLFFGVRTENVETPEQRVAAVEQQELQQEQDEGRSDQVLELFVELLEAEGRQVAFFHIVDRAYDFVQPDRLVGRADVGSVGRLCDLFEQGFAQFRYDHRYIEEGTKTVIPSKASAKISMRLVPGQDFKKIAKLFEKHFKAIAPKSVKVKVKFLHGGMPYVAPTDMPAYKAAEKAIADTFGKKPLPFYSGGSIPIISGFENILGIKSLLIGFGLAEDAIHSPNESYGLDQFYKGVETIPLFYKYFAEK